MREENTTDQISTNLLDHITSTADLKGLTVDELAQLAEAVNQSREGHAVDHGGRDRCAQPENQNRKQGEQYLLLEIRDSPGVGQGLKHTAHVRLPHRFLRPPRFSLWPWR
mgnify:CR=1 FL=1